MKRLACLLLACLTALSLTACGAPEAQEVSLFAMDTYMTLSAYGDNAEEALAASPARSTGWSHPLPHHRRQRRQPPQRR